MSTDCVISIRSHELITQLFSEIQELEGINQSKDRSAVVNRALEATAKRQIKWRDVSNSFPSANKADDTFLKIRIEQKNIDLLESVQDDIIREFNLDKLKAPFMLKLLLGAYLRVLKQEALLSSTKSLVDFGTDGLVFKQEFENSNIPHKEILLSLCREYLEKCDPDLDKRIRETSSKRIREFSDFFNRFKYLPEKSRRLSATYITYSSKVMAGIVIAITEIEEGNIEEAISLLNNEIERRK